MLILHIYIFNSICIQYIYIFHFLSLKIFFRGRFFGWDLFKYLLVELLGFFQTRGFLHKMFQLETQRAGILTFRSTLGFFSLLTCFWKGNGGETYAKKRSAYGTCP